MVIGEGALAIRRGHHGVDVARRRQAPCAVRLLHSCMVQGLVQEHAGWNRAVLVGIGLVVLGIGAVIVLQLVK